jgi:hypothetical protein
MFKLRDFWNSVHEAIAELLGIEDQNDFEHFTELNDSALLEKEIKEINLNNEIIINEE